MIPTNYRPRKRKELMQKDLNDGCILYEEKKSQMYTLNISSAFIWIYCDGEHNIDHIAQEIAATCNTPFEDALKHVTDAILLFQENGLLEPSL